MNVALPPLSIDVSKSLFSFKGNGQHTTLNNLQKYCHFPYHFALKGLIEFILKVTDVVHTEAWRYCGLLNMFWLRIVCT